LQKKCRSNSEKCYRLYELVLRKDEEAFGALMRTLMKTGNEDLVSFLWLDDFSEIFEADARKPKNSVEMKPSKNRQLQPTRNDSGKVGSGEQSVSSIIMALVVLTCTASLPFALFLYMCKAVVEKVLS
jgi:hypothetical protein